MTLEVIQPQVLALQVEASPPFPSPPSFPLKFLLFSLLAIHKDSMPCHDARVGVTGLFLCVTSLLPHMGSRNGTQA